MTADLAGRVADADEFYDPLIPATLTEDERRVERQALEDPLFPPSCTFNTPHVSGGCPDQHPDSRHIVVQTLLLLRPGQVVGRTSGTSAM